VVILMSMRARVAAHLGSREVARVVYGATIGLALVVALQDHPPAAGVMIGWLLGTAVAVALAEVYSEVVGIETSERHRVTRRQWAGLADEAAAVAFGIAFPAIFFVLVAVGLLQLDSAFHWAKWSGLGLIGFYGFWAARFSGAPVARALVQASLLAVVGAALVALKSLLH
jgi:VIT1/CCC1 family predicted Fe2+/Mn2+ transporter